MSMFYRDGRRGLVWSVAFFWLLPLLAQAQTGSLLFILDGSGSMWGQIEGQSKITIAKEVMSRLVNELPDQLQAGLQAYGHRSKGDCNDIELLVPLGQGNRTQLLAAINSLTPRGKTPISQAFAQAAEQLRAVEEETTIVLVSDGKETCAADPCVLIRQLRDSGVKVQVHVVGFDVGSEEREQLMCIAKAGGGKYFSAQNADQLSSALTEVKQAVILKAESKPVSEPSKKVIKFKRKPASGTISIPNLDGVLNTVEVYDLVSGQQTESIHFHIKSVQVPAGAYRLELHGLVLAEVEVAAGATVEAEVSTISIPNLDGALNTVEVYDLVSGQQTESIHSHIKSVQLPAGAYRLKLQGLDLAEVETIAGETVEILVGTITMASFDGIDNVTVYEQASGNQVGSIIPTAGGLQVPAGIYKLDIDGTEISDIEVAVGQEVVLE